MADNDQSVTDLQARGEVSYNESCKIKLANLSQARISCDRPEQAMGSRERKHFGEGLETLTGYSGTPCIARKGACERVSCSNDAGIWLCPNKDEDAEPDCGLIVDYVNDIFDKCQEKQDRFSVDSAWGWKESEDGWWVSVGLDMC